MQFSPRLILFSLIGFIFFLLIVFQLPLEWYKCQSKSIAVRTGFDHTISTSLKERAPLSGEDLMKLFDGVKTYVMFIGHMRSGHSLIGSLLDAHPDIIVSHECHLIETWDLEFGSESHINNKSTKYKLFYRLYSLSQEEALFDLRSPQDKSCFQGGYCYHVPGSWQGIYKHHIRVIGNKQGGATTRSGASYALKYLEQLEKIIGIPLRLVHVVRNPFDNIATIALRKAKSRDLVRNMTTKINNTEALDWAISLYFTMASTNKVILEQRGNIILQLKSHHTTLRPRQTLQKLCDHLMVTCYPEFVDACVKILYSQPAVTRNSILWTDEQKERVLKEMQKYPFLKDFNFENIP